MKFLFFLLLISFASAQAAAPTLYQCPMHPWIKSDKPGGKCTICGMALVAAPATDGAAAADPNLVTLTPSGASVIGVQTTAVRRATLVRTLRVTGIVDDDETRHRIIAARIPGRVERLFVNFVGAEVRAGAPLATIYSPAMLTAQRQYVERLRAGNIAFSVSERSAARERLLELGLTEAEVDILEHTLEPTAMVTLRSPMSGTIVARDVYEGQELNKDQSEKETRLFEIADFSSMWFVFDAYEPDLAWLRVGQAVKISSSTLAGRTLIAPIAFIDPTLNEMTRTARVRVVLENHDQALFHKQTALGEVRLELPEVLIAPRRAVLQHGAEPIVFLEQQNHSYLARRVRLGRVGDNDVEIISGLHDGDKVVTEGGLLLDGQAQLARAAITDDSHAKEDSTTGAVASGKDSASSGETELAALALAAADSASALAADDLETYRKQLPALRASLQAYMEADDVVTRNPLEVFLEGLRDRPDLRSARRDFEPFSTALADLARARHLIAKKGLHVFQCPMAPVLGIGRWISRTSQIRNPFFGSAMLECGEELRSEVGP
ncbi:MAG: cusB 1 [Verrucomicrobia bacterium]|nr:cusB 1 [Verrucomicrobiota bacterium]